ncbi:hypothetical protein, partial [Paenibacillus sp. DMB5]|uniref:hypothetical protein n=1 Tax=Paenibacillus sp. DMB5 TaxID=1780103 RepID=UPI0018E34D7B
MAVEKRHKDSKTLSGGMLPPLKAGRRRKARTASSASLRRGPPAPAAAGECCRRGRALLQRRLQLQLLIGKADEHGLAPEARSTCSAAGASRGSLPQEPAMAAYSSTPPRRQACRNGAPAPRRWSTIALVPAAAPAAGRRAPAAG